MTKFSDDFDEKVGIKIKIRRSACGLTQGEFGKKLGITPQLVQKYENGKEEITCKTLYNMATVLGTRIEYFFGDNDIYKAQNSDGFLKGASLKSARAFDGISDRSAVDLLKYYNKISDKKTKNGLIKLLRSLANVRS
jgi:transcriptional regulator with XRE-family HTH domain